MKNLYIFVRIKNMSNSKTFIVSADHSIDLITNSSSELFVIQGDEDINMIKSIIEDWLSKNSDYSLRGRNTVNSVFDHFVKIKPGVKSGTYIDDLPDDRPGAIDDARLSTIYDSFYKEVARVKEKENIDWVASFKELDEKSKNRMKSIKREISLASLENREPEIPFWWSDEDYLEQMVGKFDYKELYYNKIYIKGEDYKIGSDLSEFITETFNVKYDHL